MRLNLVVLAVLASASSTLCLADSIGPLGSASAYNLVALGSANYAGTITLGTADVVGRIAANGAITSGPYGTAIGGNTNAAIPNDPFGSPSNYVVVGSSLTAGSTLYINSGGSTYLPTNSGTEYFNESPGGKNVTTGGSGLNFTALAGSLTNLSSQLGALTATGTPRGGNSALGENPSWTVLQGVAGVNIFNITASQFATDTFDIIIPAGATVIINVTGATSYTLGNSIFINGAQNLADADAGADVLFNFDNAMSVNLSTGIDASVLAPLALLTDNGGQIDGTFIAAQIDLTNSAEAHNAEFTGTLPPPSGVTPEPSALALFGTGFVGLAGLVRRRRA